MENKNNFTTFKTNIHKAKNISLKTIDEMIETYDPRYKPPKYFEFIKTMLLEGWNVKLYTAGVSKYVFVSKGDHIYKIRFSNHKPIYTKELQNDCDFYVGITHQQASKTEQVIEKILHLYHIHTNRPK